MPLPYKKVLVLGATSGIGHALAEKFVETGTFVIVSGRRQENLDSFTSKHGKDKSDAVAFDITQLDKIPTFAADVMKSHPDLDCVFMNSGIQRGLDFSKPEKVDLDTVYDEFNTNYLSYLHLTKAFLPYLQKQKNETSIIYTTSGLALVPIMHCPNYCASKAALHHFILVLREQMKSADGNVKIIELFPPAVQTELHDAKHQPDIKDGGKIGMPLKDFTEEAYEGLSNGQEQVAVQMVKTHMGFNSWEQERQKNFYGMIEAMKKMVQKNE